VVAREQCGVEAAREVPRRMGVDFVVGCLVQTGAERIRFMIVTELRGPV